uniref:Thymidylate kinase n=1 Tax=Magnetococcus massalia (strain MO-1) TaxID=451514 RepID=A0A1S7LFZ2_MAGMO|nr:thymidylate kinase [Candidatus Magnetococcus massalia]
MAKRKGEALYGHFITFEGGEGAGKTTQISLLAEQLKAEGIEVVVTREPGGCPMAERIRELLVSGRGDDLDGTSELLLILAARHEHIRQRIRPALERGAWVLCDRFEESTLAYQGAGRGGDEAWIRQLGSWVRGGIGPDLTLLLDLDPEIGLARSTKRGGDAQRFEQEALRFHQLVREHFLALAEQDSQRIHTVDAGQTPEQVGMQIWQRVTKQLLT